MSDVSPTPLRDLSVAVSAPPARRTLRLLRRNRLAMIGVVLVSGMVLLILLGPWLSRDDPRQLRPWLRAQPPGVTHPDCAPETRLEFGKAVSPGRGSEQVRQLTFRVESSHSDRYRIVVRRGKIGRITRERGAVAVPELDLRDPDIRLFELSDEGDPVARTGGFVIRSGAPPPEGLLGNGQRVALLELRRRGETPVSIRADLQDGVVTGLTRDGEPIASVTLRAADVLAVEADGVPRLRRHLLGTDDLGRDLFSRILYGGRISLLVGIVATAVSLCIGVFYGALAGYLGGRVDRVMMAGVDILYAIPFMFLVIILLVNFGRSLVMLFIALGAVQWLTMARIVRGQILSLKEREFIDAARLSGAGPLQMLFRHLIPHTMGPVIVYTTLTVPAVILEESFLAFIGLSVQYHGQNLDSWGALVRQGMLSIGAGGARSWLLVWPSLAMAVTLLGLNCLGDGLRDILDPRSRRPAR